MKEENKWALKELRADTGLNQRQFASYFRIPLRTLQEWEAGNRRVPEYFLRLMFYVVSHETFLNPDAFFDMDEEEIWNGFSIPDEFPEPLKTGNRAFWRERRRVYRQITGRLGRRYAKILKNLKRASD